LKKRRMAKESTSAKSVLCLGKSKPAKKQPGKPPQTNAKKEKKKVEKNLGSGWNEQKREEFPESSSSKLH